MNELLAWTIVWMIVWTGLDDFLDDGLKMVWKKVSGEVV
jgi:hypothetical protein